VEPLACREATLTEVEEAATAAEEECPREAEEVPRAVTEVLPEEEAATVREEDILQEEECTNSLPAVTLPQELTLSQARWLLTELLKCSLLNPFQLKFQAASLSHKARTLFLVSLKPRSQVSDLIQTSGSRISEKWSTQESPKAVTLKRTPVRLLESLLTRILLLSLKW